MQLSCLVISPMSGVLVKAGTFIPRGPRYLVYHAPAVVTIGCDGFQMTSTREKYSTHCSLHERLYPLSPEASIPNGQWVQWYKKCPFCLMGVCLALYSICHQIKTRKLYLVTCYLLRVNPGSLQSTMKEGKR